MPMIQHFVVTQTRFVNVEANSIEDAARIASLAFNTDDGIHRDSEVWGTTTSDIVIDKLEVVVR